MTTNSQDGIELSPLQRVVLFCGFALATFMMVLDYSIANVSIPYIAGDLAISADEGTYVITSFAVGNAICLALSGWLSKQFQQVRLLLISIVFFTFFSWTCGASRDLESLVISRFLQGFTSGPLVPLSQSLLLNTTTPSKRTIALALWGMIIMTAPVFGPILGGYISENYYWPWIFYINIPVGIICFLIIASILKNYKTLISKIPTNWIGIILLTLAVTSLQIVLDKGQEWDWLNSPLVRTLCVVSTISFTFLFIWEFYHKHPILELRLFQLKSFALSIVCLAVSYAIYFGALVLVPLWLQTSMGYTATWAGIAVSPVGIAPALLSIFTAKMLMRTGPIPLLILCFAVFAGACFYSAYFNTDVTITKIGIGRFLTGLGMTLYITPLLSLNISEVSPERMPSATSMFHFFRSLVGAFGTSIFTTMLQRRSIYHHFTLGSNLTPYTPNSYYFLEDLQSKGLEGKAGLTALNLITNKQAAMLSINDCFYVMGWAFVGLAILVSLGLLFTRKPKPSTATLHMTAD